MASFLFNRTLPVFPSELYGAAPALRRLARLIIWSPA